MNHKEFYQTNQKTLVKEYLKKKSGAHTTAKEIYEALKKDGVKIGLTTVYRHLETMTKEGSAIKTIIDENTPACFEYSGHDHQEAHPCFHCKCIECGRLIHLHCDEIEKLEEHIYEDHHFTLDPRRTVFFGVCDECQK